MTSVLPRGSHPLRVYLDRQALGMGTTGTAHGLRLPRPHACLYLRPLLLPGLPRTLQSNSILFRAPSAPIASVRRPPSLFPAARSQLRVLLLPTRPFPVAFPTHAHLVYRRHNIQSRQTLLVLASRRVRPPPPSRQAYLHPLTASPPLPVRIGAHRSLCILITALALSHLPTRTFAAVSVRSASPVKKPILGALTRADALP